MRAEHRSLSLDKDSGLFFCHRCEAKGILAEFAGNQTPSTDRLPIATRKALVSRPERKRYDFDSEIRKARPLADTPGAAYLESRGIPVDVAHASGVRFAGGFLGRPAVLFPLRDGDGRLVAAQGRISRSSDGWKRTIQRGGGGHGGVFVTAGAFEAEVVVVTEAPIDALSLATCGVPSIGLVGVRQCPDWLPRRLAFRRVFLAFDADDAGDKEAETLGRAMAEGFGIRAERLRPAGGPKDWNESLQAVGVDALTNDLNACLGGQRFTLNGCERGGG